MRLNGTSEVIDGQEFPVTTDELVEDHGDAEIELVSGTETLGETLERLGPETFETREELRLSVYTAVPGDAVGRRHYSDRDPAPIGSQYGPKDVSF